MCVDYKRKCNFELKNANDLKKNKKVLKKYTLNHNFYIYQ